MSQNNLDFEAIVREVLRRLALLSQPSAALVLADRLVTLATLEGKLAGVNQVRVSARAVVTPAVRDALRDKKIELVRQ